jgi:signal transduction histidine kinase
VSGSHRDRARRWTRPLDRLPSIRAKLGSVIVFAVAVTILIMYLTVGFALRKKEQGQQFLILQEQTQTVVAAGFSDAGNPTAALIRVLDKYRRPAVIVDSAGDVLVQQFPTPSSVTRVLHGQTDTGEAGGSQYYGYPVYRSGRGIVAAVYLARPVAGGGVSGAVRTTLSLLKSVWWQLLLAGAISAAIALGLARLMARGMTQPIRDMAAAANRLSRGEYGERVAVESRDEIGQLAETFNRMATELESLERLRRDLVANVSHELKTPIAALRAHLENLLDGVEEPKRETLQVMLEQSERLSRLVEEVLDLSRLESGGVTLTMEPVRLAPLVRQVGREIQIGREKSILFHNEVPSELPPVRADSERLHQVLFNLLDNAFRFTPAGGSVTVSAARVDGSCEVTVDDTGPGIPEEHLPFVFERFYRVDSARSRGDGGTGIGLTIVRTVVEAHGGHIWAERREEGGSRFRFELPFDETEPAEGRTDGTDRITRPTPPPRRAAPARTPVAMEAS